MNRQVFQQFFFFYYILFTIFDFSTVFCVRCPHFDFAFNSFITSSSYPFCKHNKKKTTPKFLIIIQMDLMYFLMNVCDLCSHRQHSTKSATLLFIACLCSFHRKIWIFSLFCFFFFSVLMALLWYRIWQSPLKCEAMKTILRPHHPLQNTNANIDVDYTQHSKRKKKINQQPISIDRTLVYRNNEFDDQFIWIQLGVWQTIHTHTVWTRNTTETIKCADKKCAMKRKIELTEKLHDFKCILCCCFFFFC